MVGGQPGGGRAVRGVRHPFCYKAGGKLPTADAAARRLAYFMLMVVFIGCATSSSNQREITVLVCVKNSTACLP